MLTDVLNYMDDVTTASVGRWKDKERTVDLWDGIWADAAKMELALEVVVWQPSSTVPTAAEVIAAKTPYETWFAEQVALAPARELEAILRTDPRMRGEVALRARDEDKTIDEIIAETVAKV